MRKAVIIIAAGNNQVLVIKKAKKMGFAVICIDRDPNAIGFQFCDEKINLSTYESKPIIAYLKKLQKKYEFFGVINRSSGIPVITCAEICSTFKLPGINPTAAKNIIDKSELMSFCKINNISAPFSISARIFAEIDNKSIKFPCIVKPALSIIGKSGVVMVKNEEELEIAFNIAQKSSINGIVDIEEYVKGYDITLMAIVRNGVIYPITLLDEINSIDDNGKIFGIGFAVPSIFSGRQEEDKILSLAQKIVRAFKLDTTVFLMSCRCDFGQNPKLIEIHLDFGGDLVLDYLIPTSTDFDVLKVFIDAMTRQFQNFSNVQFDPTAIIYEKGGDLVSERLFTLYKAESMKQLHQNIEKFHKNRRYNS